MRPALPAALLIALALPLAPPAAAPAVAQAAPGCGGARDLDGDGRPDLAVGAPSATVGGQVRAGQVAVAYADGRTRWFAPATGRPHDGFGAALASGDLDGDGCADLAVGVPGAAAVRIYLGGQPELREGPLLRGGAGLGTALAVADLDGDRDLELVAGAPEAPGGGRVVVYGLRAKGVGAAKTFPARLGRAKERRAETDALGSALAVGDFNGDGRPEIAIGIPGAGHRGQGAVTVLDPLRGRARVLSQAGPVRGGPERDDGFGTSLAAADFDRDGKADLAIGVPGEAFTHRDKGAAEGAVHVLYGPSFRERGPMWNRGTKGVPGELRRRDFFGAALAAGDLTGDGRPDLAIGIPGSNAVQLLTATRSGALKPGRLLRPGLPAAAHYGLTLRITSGTLYVGAPGADSFTGALYRSTTRLPLDGRGLTAFSLS
ncbi:FG-GAP-like repeat-containing protein [Actinocorallia sp. API 0066]|uniref:FG-GAP and VCBS repeat-containing protein n=1 Tax=Actinocorallia sp. API 0066 TaxID=2896846 RepID=UPI001E3692A9|nr:FG-GAP and VCBS repeat-containing protein [Actinocorallia sp. API 0066]MCD0448956.1 FG-GAP-like repeat-containing protein [Actinocorallia sp. API 0066]